MSSWQSRFAGIPLGNIILTKGQKLVRKLHHRLPHPIWERWLHKSNIWLEDASFAQWKAKNPQQSYADFYANKQLFRLKRGDAHPTLGKKLEGEKPYSKRGLAAFQLLCEQGLQSHHRCLDYGCGSLRIGQHVIRHLNAGNYWGLDITDQFYLTGKEMLGNPLIETKSPNLHIINKASLALAKEAKPDYIFSFAVLIHVPPAELETYFGNILSLAHKQTIILIHANIAGILTHYSTESWAYPLPLLQQKIQKLGGNCDIVRQKKANIKYKTVTEHIDSAWLKITKSN